MADKIDIIIVDDHAIFRDGLKSLLSEIQNIEVIGEAKNGKELLALLKKKKPDIVLMDISMPEMDGIEATQKALVMQPELKVITLSSYSDHIYYYKMINAGVQGFVLKKSGMEEVQEAINTVYKGENYFPPKILKNLIIKISKSGTESVAYNDIVLSLREKEVLQLICQGHTNNEIAEMLHISPRTVDNNRTKLLSKTATKNSAHLVMFAIKHHLVEI